MTVFFDKTKGRWRYDFERAGRRYARYCLDAATGEPARSRRQAEAIEAAIKAAIDARRPPKPPPGTYTLAHAMAAYRDVAQHRRNWPTIKGYVAELLAQLGPSTALAAIDEARIAEYVTWARQQPHRVYVGGPRPRQARQAKKREREDYGQGTRKRSEATIGKYLNALRAAWRIAAEAKLAPAPPRIPRFTSPRTAGRPLGLEALQKIMARAPGHVRDLVLVALHTGLRLQEALRLEESWIAWEQRAIHLPPASTKANRGDVVPINEHAYQLLRRLAERARQAGQARLILYDQRRRRGGETVIEPRPVASVRRAWRRVLDDLGLGRHRFHDTRADFISALHAQALPPAEIQAAARHASFATTLRYIGPLEARRRQALEGLGAHFAALAPAPATPENAAENPTRESHTAARPARRRSAKSLK